MIELNKKRIKLNEEKENKYNIIKSLNKLKNLKTLSIDLNNKIYKNRGIINIDDELKNINIL